MYDISIDDELNRDELNKHHLDKDDFDRDDIHEGRFSAKCITVIIRKYGYL